MPTFTTRTPAKRDGRAETKARTKNVFGMWHVKTKTFTVHAGPVESIVDISRGVKPFQLIRYPV
jgi:hypothetical protein